MEEDTILSDPIIEPPNAIDDDSDDIQVRPIQKPTSRPTQMTTQVTTNWWQTTALTTTTKRPVTTVSTNLEDRYKVVCYYTNWAWYR